MRFLAALGHLEIFWIRISPCAQYSFLQLRVLFPSERRYWPTIQHAADTFPAAAPPDHRTLLLPLRLVILVLRLGCLLRHPSVPRGPHPQAHELAAPALADALPRAPAPPLLLRQPRARPDGHLHLGAHHPRPAADLAQGLLQRALRAAAGGPVRDPRAPGRDGRGRHESAPSLAGHRDALPAAQRPRADRRERRRALRIRVLVAQGELPAGLVAHRHDPGARAAGLCEVALPLPVAGLIFDDWDTCGRGGCDDHK